MTFYVPYNPEKLCSDSRGGRPFCGLYVDDSVPTDRRSFRTGPKKILEDRSVQDLKIAKRTSKDLFFDPGTIISFFSK